MPKLIPSTILSQITRNVAVAETAAAVRPNDVDACFTRKVACVVVAHINYGMLLVPSCSDPLYVDFAAAATLNLSTQLITV